MPLCCSIAPSELHQLRFVVDEHNHTNQAVVLMTVSLHPAEKCRQARAQEDRLAVVAQS